jgi:hypothetical protein
MAEITEVELILGRVCPAVGLVGFIFNLLVFLIFSTQNFREPILYKYLKLEAMFICFDMFITMFKPIYYCDSCEISRTMASQIYFVYFNIYCASFLEMSAIICRNFSALICLLLISNRFKKLSNFLTKKSFFKFIILGIVLVSCIIYSYSLFEYQIIEIIGLANETRMYAAKTDFGKGNLKADLEIGATIVRDCVNLFILVVVNILIIVQLKINLKKKRKILLKNGNELTKSVAIDEVQSVSTVNGNEILKNIQRKENLQTLMVILTCVNYLCGRLPLLYIFIKRNIFEDRSNVGIYAILVAYISYTINFSLYYFSNYKFKFTVNSYIKKLLFLFRLN